MSRILIYFFWNAIVTSLSAKNVLFLFCDDSGREMGAYGHAQVVSPNLDYLANHSMVFNYGYTSVSSCSPSRSAVLSGIPVHQNGMYGLEQGIDHFQSFEGPKTIGKLLSANGYYTGLIGKYHVAPQDVYYFDYIISDITGYNVNTAGRNITFMKQKMTEFLDTKVGNKSWFLEMAFHDTHRGCGGAQGPFCNNWGNGTNGMGNIPDWKPINYDATKLKLPYWIPDAPQARNDYAAYLEGFSRLDQGVGLFLNILKDRKLLNDTLIIFSSDNGEPFPSAKTNLYEQGQIEPFMISIPEFWEEENREPIYTDYLAGNTDILPTILEWVNITYPSYKLNGHEVILTGESLLHVVQNNITKNTRKSNVYGSHIMHQITMYYPMRCVRNGDYRLIHNLLFQAPYHIAGDIFGSATWQYILSEYNSNSSSNYWYKNVTEYFFREEWELYDIVNDEMQLTNLAYDPKYKNVFNTLSANISTWVKATYDPWICKSNYNTDCAA
eukprot:141264_1